jgi:hypothetical protein
MLTEKSWSLGAEHVAERQRGDDCVVELSGDRDEVWNEIDRHRQVDNKGEQDQLPSARDAVISHQSPQEDQAVRDEPDEGACCGPASRDEQPRHEKQVRVARDGTDLRGEELEVSILFMDVRGFTSFSEQAPAREVVAA